jgi:polyphosphate kinase
VRARCVLGRFLEHSRFLIFRRGEESRYLLGSADLLPRNLDHRIEVVAPIDARLLQAELDAVFDALIKDNAQARELDAEGR